MEWTEQQEAVFKHVADRYRSATVQALAGCGKTSLAVEAARRVDGRVMMTSFSTGIVETLKKRKPPNAEVATLHSMGLRLMRNVQVDKDKGDRIAMKVSGNNRRLASVVRRAVSLSKGYLLDEPKAIREEVLDEHDLDAQEFGVQPEKLAELAVEAMREAREDAKTCDFDDMIWLPVKLGLKMYKQPDVIFGDEFQDANAVQTALIDACAGDAYQYRIGDKNQAIYAWRGASGDALHVPGWDVLPLTVTFRCPKSVVAEAKIYVPDFEAHPSAPEGIVKRGTKELLREVRPGDFVLARTNAQVVKLCVRAIRDGKRATIIGRNLGDRLSSIVRNIGGVDSDLRTMLSNVKDWCNSEVAKRIEQDRPHAHITDQAACIEAFADQTRTVQEVLSRIAGCFLDDGFGHIMFSTVHRVKGLEADRVFVLKDSFMRFGKTDEARAEERNIYYVAVTRAKSELYLVAGDA